MNHFEFRDGVMHAEDIPLPLIAEEIGTPVYVYSRATLERHAQAFRDGLKDVPKKHLAFAIKSNPNLGVLRVLARQGYGADVVSGGELERALAAGMAAEDIVFSGVGKTRAELAQGHGRLKGHDEPHEKPDEHNDGKRVRTGGLGHAQGVFPAHPVRRGHGPGQG